MAGEQQANIDAPDDEVVDAQVVENEIVNVIVHSLVRTKAGFVIENREEVLEVGDTVQRLIDQYMRVKQGSLMVGSKRMLIYIRFRNF
ncbi:TPA: hypothetical protein OTZ10_006244 [Pseudomonas aeruginosa]|nr:hypothetical protein [Pseudomonas aeruginosa]